jgi:hypothetical protein
VICPSFYGLLYISSLPSIKDLRAWQHNGIGYLLNVSGIDINEMYSTNVFESFQLVQITFADIFTKGDIVNVDATIDKSSSENYLQLATDEEQQALLSAVQALVEQFQLGTQSCVFCHRGQGRSPLVAAAALGRFYRESIAQAIARTRIIHPPAIFTDISLSALQWCSEQVKP